MEKQKSANKQKLALGALALVAATGVIIGTGYAYFSDVITGEGSATAGTLDITGTVTLAQNGDVVDGEIENLNPGDLLTIAADSIVNKGSKSAWVRTVIDFTELSAGPYAPAACSGYTGDEAPTTQAACTTAGGTWTEATPGNLADYIYVCPSTATDSDLRSAADAAALLTLDCELANVTGDFGATDPAIIDGTAEDDVVIATGAAGQDSIYSTTLPAGNLPKIYFAHFAGNVAQAGTMDFEVKLEAIQYRNNTDNPNDADWDAVTATEFSL